MVYDLNSKKKLRSSPAQVNYELRIVGNLETTGRVITGPHCIKFEIQPDAQTPPLSLSLVVVMLVCYVDVMK